MMPAILRLAPLFAILFFWGVVTEVLLVSAYAFLAGQRFFTPLGERTADLAFISILIFTIIVGAGMLVLGGVAIGNEALDAVRGAR